MKRFHVSVLLQKTLEELRVKAKARYIDATIGGGGYSFEILKQEGKVLGIDVDQDALDYVRERWEIESRTLKIQEENLVLVKGNFREIDRIAFAKGFNKVSGIVFDLGVSSYQLETAERGFSFLREGPLDMRMDKELSVKASDLINVLTKNELYELFSKLGEESNLGSILERIIRARGIKPIKTTKELVEIIEEEKAKKFLKINRATKIFQALRIAVNDELNALREALPKAVRILEEKGRILVISFHSLEDRIVKRAFLEFEEKNLGKVITKKPIRPTLKEINLNKRSRSAKLRIFEKN